MSLDTPLMYSKSTNISVYLPGEALQDGVNAIKTHGLTIHTQDRVTCTRTHTHTILNTVM